MMQLQDFRPGQAYDVVNVATGGINIQSAAYSGSTEGKSNYYGPTSVSGLNFQGMPSELARELGIMQMQMQLQQHQQVSPLAGHPVGQATVGKPVTTSLTVPAFVGTGHSVGR